MALQKHQNKHKAKHSLTLMFPSILRFANCRFSSSSVVSGIPSFFSKALVAWARFSNSVRHLFSRSSLNVQGLPAGSKFGASSVSRLHSCAYIELYFGSSSAFSKICKTDTTTISKATS